MAFEKIVNFRDVGISINTFTGQSLLRPGLFFRSGVPYQGTEVDQARLHGDFKIKTVIDLRTDSERLEQHRQEDVRNDAQQSARVAGMPDVEYRSISLNGHAYSMNLMKRLSYWNAAKLIVLYLFGWRDQAISILGHNVMAKRGLTGLAEDSLTASTAEVKAVFDLLSDEDSYPVLVHCTQGKDRTGLIVLLVLLLLGVPSEAVHADYMTSEDELKSERESRLVQIRNMGLPDDFAQCAEGWVQAMTDWLGATYGGVEQYLSSCGVSKEQREQIRSILLRI